MVNVIMEMTVKIEKLVEVIKIVENTVEVEKFIEVPIIVD